MFKTLGYKLKVLFLDIGNVFMDAESFESKISDILLISVITINPVLLRLNGKAKVCKNLILSLIYLSLFFKVSIPNQKLTFE